MPISIRTIDAAGLAALNADLARISAARTHADIIRLMAADDLAGDSPIRVFPALDARRPTQYVVTMSHGGLGMPEREYYRRTDGQFPAIRDAYRAYIERALSLAGQANPGAKARTILALETQIAERHWTIADRRQRDRLYNLHDRSQLRAIAPSFPWDAGLEAAGLGETREVVVRELSAMRRCRTFMATRLKPGAAILPSMSSATRPPRVR